MKHLIFILGFGVFINAQNFKQDSIQIKQIFDYNLTQGEAYTWLKSLCKDVGHRLSGSENAAKAVKWSEALMKSQNFDKVWLQPTMVPHWERGAKEEAYYLLGSEKHDLSILALGSSIATPEKGILAEVIEVKSLADLQLKKDLVKGKIVFINQKMDATLLSTFEAYGKCVEIRYKGASEAGALGAVAVLTRSLTTELDDYPHTGVMAYNPNLSENQKIPAASISTLDSEELSMVLQKHPKTKIYFKQNCKTLPDEPSYNVIAELKGSEFPNKIITVGGHLDSWDVGEGAHDDGAGVVQSLEVLKTFKALQIKPKHTVRVVFFMNEENGTRGGKTYALEADKNKEEAIWALESDSGGFTPRGFGIDDTQNTFVKQIEAWKTLLAPYGLREIGKGNGGADIHPLRDYYKIVLVGYKPDSQRYFNYHHTSNDVFENVNYRELQLGAASMASLVYLVDKYFESL